MWIAWRDGEPDFGFEPTAGDAQWVAWMFSYYGYNAPVSKGYWTTLWDLMLHGY